MKQLWTACAGAALLSLAAAQPAGAQNTLKIGSVLSITGPAAFLGEPEEKTIKMYVEKVNASSRTTK
jgi:branched-chain amino acid transport system substrate-binding protein